MLLFSFTRQGRYRMDAVLMFVFRALALEEKSRFIALALAVGICVYNYVDVGRLQGQLYGTADRAPIAYDGGAEGVSGEAGR